MSRPIPEPRRVNPFSTRFIRPGRVRPLDAAGLPLPLDSLSREARRHRICALVGGHGSGKSNLLNALATTLAREVVVHRVGVRSVGDVAVLVRTMWSAGGGAIVCVDGWERLGWIVRRLMPGVARLRGCRLLVTAHRAGGLPVLVHCATSLELLAGVIAELPPAALGLGPAERAAAFARHAGNLRETLLDLYDRFEERFGAGPAAAAGMTVVPAMPVVAATGNEFTRPAADFSRDRPPANLG